MMTEISLNILDVAENSIRADASHISIEVLIQTKADTLTILIEDDGCGMDEEQVMRVIDPFFTTRNTRKVGLGIPFFKQAAESTGGSFAITSKVGCGTKVKAVFKLSHIDRMPLGDINTTIHTLIVFNESIDFRYKYVHDCHMFELNTEDMKAILGDVSFKDLEVSKFIKEYLDENKKEADNGTEI